VALYLLGWIGVGALAALNLLLAISLPFVVLITLPVMLVAARRLSRSSGPAWCKWGVARSLVAGAPGLIRQAAACGHDLTC
jgi:hypothetical protein